MKEVMRVLQSSIFRALCSLIIGALLIKYPSDTATWIVILIGVLFLLSGIISCVAYFYSRKQYYDNIVTNANGRVISGGMPAYPILGLGSLLLGLILTLRPGAVIDIMAYILGGILIVGSLSQIASLISATRVYHIPVLFWISPLLILVVGLVSIIKPEWIASAPLMVLGWCLVLYGITEIINTLKIYSARKRAEKEQQMANNEIITDDVSQ